MFIVRLVFLAALAGLGRQEALAGARASGAADLGPQSAPVLRNVPTGTHLQVPSLGVAPLSVPGADRPASDIRSLEPSLAPRTELPSLPPGVGPKSPAPRSARKSRARSSQAILPRVREMWTGADAPKAGEGNALSGRLFDNQRGVETLADSEPISAAPELYDVIHPRSYDLKIALDPGRRDFTGEVEIRGDVVRKTRTLTLHSLDLKIEEAYVNGRKIAASRIKEDRTAEKISLELGKEFVGPVTIEIKYGGKLNRQMRGLYQSEAIYQGCKERYAFTQLAATDARRMFPCVDEPVAKARFRLTVAAPRRLTVLSNMPAQREKSAGEFRVTTFQNTPRMSSYLLALAAARLVPKGIRAGKTKVTAWTMPQDSDKVDFALKAAKEALTYLRRYMGLPYTMPELKLIAVPDFAAQAMENWGALFFRDSAIFIDPKNVSIEMMKWVATTIWHEIIHDIYGDLVTMRSWDDTWLNEGFAEWLAHKLVDQWHPEWNIWLHFENLRQIAMSIDALPSTRPVISPARSSAEIEEMFGDLTYDKGGAFLRMLEHFLGERSFRAGVRTYVRRYSYKNARAADLWRELRKASGQSVDQMARSWLEQPGVPIVTVGSVSQDNRTLTLAQRPFYARGEGDPSRRWIIPIAIKYKVRGEKGVRTHRVLLEEGAKMIRLLGKGSVEWAYPNEDETGYYRVALDKKLMEALGIALKSKSAGLATIERVGYLSSLWARVKSGQAPVDVMLDALLQIKKDESWGVLEAVGKYVGAMADDLAGSAQDRARLARYVQDLLGDHWRRLGWDARAGEDENARLARAEVLSTLGAVAPSREFRLQVRERLKRYWKDPSSTDPDLVSTLLMLGARMGDARSFERYREEFLRLSRSEEANPELKEHYLKALASFPRKDLARKVLKMTLSDDIRGQDVYMPIASLLNSPSQAVQQEAWDFIRKNWKGIRAKAGTDASVWVIESLPSLWRTDWRDQVRDFFRDKRNQVDAAKRTLDQSLEEMELGIQFKDAQAGRLSEWLKRRYPEKPAAQ